MYSHGDMTLAELQAHRARLVTCFTQAELGFTETEIDGLRVKLTDPAKIKKQIQETDVEIALKQSGGLLRHSVAVFGGRR